VPFWDLFLGPKVSAVSESKIGAPPWRDHLPYGGPRGPPAEWSRLGGVMATQAHAKGTSQGLIYIYIYIYNYIYIYMDSR
jgi:hypothetical protein